ncbi:hypothetical protein HY3_09170 [Hyphomonas pacifica]|uniref:4-O-methyl-glucuronoyl methylesterase-like domain-containing protein n=1 Tax=Hyphomonas pacifica TaxID=1280941 RepID=A0A8B2PP18_9PROT|nr:hypothetical protein HY3_09170 [Hyphomonas pacifica]RAN37296.1 hypothetical protein HY11_09380 [Hyphomonas pacifica]
MIIWCLVRLPLLILILVLGLVMSSCTMLGLNYASLEVDNKPAPSPAIEAQALVNSSQERAALMEKFENTLYGPWPKGMPVTWGEAQIVSDNILNGKGVLKEMPVTVGEGAGARTFFLVVALPKGEGPFPVVISETFSSNCSVFPEYPVTSSDGSVCDGSDMDGIVGALVGRMFGEYIALAPLDQFMEAGIAYASFYGPDLVPDSREQGPVVMARLGGPTEPTGTLMAWAYGFSAAIDALTAETAIDPDAVSVMGHSRYGKSALIAGVWDRRIGAVVAHQSGFAGASLSRSHTGEGLQRMAKTYPHWLAPEVQPWLDYLDELPVDQHELLALLAPTPVLLGNGRRDVWSDPNSSFRAAMAASAVYEAMDLPGLPEAGMQQDFRPSAGIAWWLRSGGHSIVSEDVDTFVAFLQAHLSDSSRRGSAVQNQEKRVDSAQ